MERKKTSGISEYEKELYQMVSFPLKVDFHLKDVLQVIIGATILAVPVGFTEEVWVLGEVIPILNVFLIMIMSIFFISAFVYYHYYRSSLGEHWDKFLKRTIFTYVFAFIVVGMILTLIQKAPWGVDYVLAFKRVVIVTLPASMSASIADTIK